MGSQLLLRLRQLLLGQEEQRSTAISDDGAKRQRTQQKSKREREKGAKAKTEREEAVQRVRFYQGRRKTRRVYGKKYKQQQKSSFVFASVLRLQVG
jgi:hypothetical protein